MHLESSGKTSKGKVRTENQDSLFIDDELGVWLVADGMGGHAGGALASEIVSIELPRLLQTGMRINQAIYQCHHRLVEIQQARPKYKDMGSTLVLSVWRDNKLHIYWVGDSRAYLSSSEGLSLLTKDHSLVQKMIDLKLLNEHSAKCHPHKNVLTQCLGGGSRMKPEIGSLELDLAESDAILLCSDGLHNELTDLDIWGELGNSKNNADVVEQLIEQANNKGGKDNISAIVIRPRRPRPKDSLGIFSQLKNWLDLKFLTI